MRRQKITVTTAADGSAIAYMPRMSGRIHAIHYVKTDYANGVDFSISAEATGETIWAENDVNASTVRYPRAPTHSQAGAAALYATGGTAVMDKIAIANDRIKIVIAQGGANKSGTFHVLIG